MKLTIAGFRLIALVSALLYFTPGYLHAEDLGPINTERPSFSFSPLALGSGLVQIETGYLYTVNDETSTKHHTAPNLLLRFGITDKLDFQLGSAGYKWQETYGSQLEGTHDPTLALKWQVNDAGSTVPVALYGAVSLPTGSDEFSSGDHIPFLGLIWSHTAALNWFGTALLSHADDLFILDNAIGISFSLPGVSGAYVEYLGNFQEDQGSSAAHALNSGVSWVISNDLQLDLNGSVGLNSSANSYALGAGFSYRFR